MDAMQKFVLAFLILACVSSIMVSAVAVSTALSSISGNYTIVWFYNASDTSHWKRYIPNNVTPNTLTQLYPEYGYWVNVNVSSETLELTGTTLSSTSISLLDGWNLIGYPSLTAQSVSTVLAAINGNYTIVWFYNASDTSHWKRYIPNNVTPNAFTTMYPGSGYWVRLNVSTETLVI